MNTPEELAEQGGKTTLRRYRLLYGAAPKTTLKIDPALRARGSVQALIGLRTMTWMPGCKPQIAGERKAEAGANHRRQPAITMGL